MVEPLAEDFIATVPLLGHESRRLRPTWDRRATRNRTNEIESAGKSSPSRTRLQVAIGVDELKLYTTSRGRNRLEYLL